MSTSTIEYVPSTDTIADIAIAQTQSTSLRTSSAILLSLLFISSFILNLIVIAAILAGKKLRASLFRRLLVLLSFVHIFFLFTVLLPSLIFVANGTWTLGDFFCRGNAFCQQFCALYGTLLLLTMATERASAITQHPLQLFGGYKTIVFISITFVIALSITIPIFFPVMPVRKFMNRYLCSIGENAPIYRAAFQTFIYLVSLLGMLICTGAIYARRQISSIPQQSHEFTQFITRTRALQEDTQLGKLTVRLFCAFVIISGPYIVLELILEISDSKEIRSGLSIEQDVDTLLTWLSFIYSLISPILIFCSCDDLWSQVLETFCCKSQEPPTIGSYFMGNSGKNNSNGVMTLVATSEGVQLRLPPNIQYPSLQMAPAYDECINYETPMPQVVSHQVDPDRGSLDRGEDYDDRDRHEEQQQTASVIHRDQPNRRSRIPEPQAGRSVPNRLSVDSRRPTDAGGIKKSRPRRARTQNGQSKRKDNQPSQFQKTKTKR